jgi:hypothetical protein
MARIRFRPRAMRWTAIPIATAASGPMLLLQCPQGQLCAHVRWRSRMPTSGHRAGGPGRVGLRRGIVLSAAKRPSRLDYARVCECAKAGVVSCVSLEPIINARLTAASHERRWSARLNGADLTAQGGKARSGACNAGRRVLMLALEADLERLDERGDRVVGFANPSGGFRVD